jgi:outer membrane protein OmpA-like peptidoglycan-associated protein
MRTKRYKRNVESTSYDLSISDMMAALCCVFVLICVTVMVRLTEQKAEFQRQNKKANSYYAMRTDLYEKLMETFKDEVNSGKVSIDEKTLTISFKNPDVLFEMNDTKLRDEYKQTLNDFFPKLVKLLYTSTYTVDGVEKPIKDEIEEIRIEGHTATSVKLTAKENYERGMETSQERTRNILNHCINSEVINKKIPNEQMNWIKKNIAAIGYSNSRHITYPDTNIENQDASRRVDFRLLTNATNVLTEIENFTE